MNDLAIYPAVEASLGSQLFSFLPEERVWLLLQVEIQKDTMRNTDKSWDGQMEQAAPVQPSEKGARSSAGFSFHVHTTTNLGIVVT